MIISPRNESAAYRWQWWWVAAVAAACLGLVLALGYQLLWDDNWFRLVVPSMFEGNLWAYLAARFENFTSRIVVEIVLQLVIRHILLWQILTAAAFTVLIVLPVWLFTNSPSLRIRLLPLSAIFVAALPAAIIFETGYVATTLMYLWPLAAGLIAAIPAVRYLRGQKTHVITWVIAGLFWIFAANIELVSVFLFLLYAGVTGRLLYQGRELPRNTRSWLPPAIWALASLGALLFHLWAPGNAGRVISETEQWFPAFEFLTFGQRVGLAFSATVYAIFMQGYLLPVLFFVLVVGLLYARHHRAIWLALGALPAITALLLGFSHPRTPLHQSRLILRELEPQRNVLPTRFSDTLTVFGFIQPDNAFSWFVLLLQLALLIAALGAVVKLVGVNGRLVAILLILAGGIGSRFIFGFTPTVWASGDRTNTFLLYAFGLASLLLLTWQFADNYSQQEIQVQPELPIETQYEPTTIVESAAIMEQVTVDEQVPLVE